MIQFQPLCKFKRFPVSFDSIINVKYCGLSSHITEVFLRKDGDGSGKAGLFRTMIILIMSIPPCSILVNICPGEMWWNVCPPVMCSRTSLLHLNNFYQFKFFQPVDHLRGRCQKLHKSSQKLLSLTKFSEFQFVLV